MCQSRRARLTAHHSPLTTHHPLVAAILALLGLLAGCRQQRQFYFFKDEQLTHYRHVASEIETPVEACCHESPPPSSPPITPETFEKMPLWDLPLQEAIGMSLANSKIARRLPAGPPSLLLDNPESLATVFDPAITASGVPGSPGGIGVEAALSAFDAQLNASMLWERNERPINTGGIGEQIFARNFEQDRASFIAELSKTNATGGRTFLRHNVLYDLNNNPTRGVPSDYSLNYEMGIVQPLLQGAGVEFNRIAGPLTGTEGFINRLAGGGVMIARINEDVSLADFEKAVRDATFDVENAYWDLYVAYRTFDSVKAGRDAALFNWRRVQHLKKAGAIGGEALILAQARSQYYRFRGDVDEALCALLRAESRLRYLMGLPASDGRLIRPQDDPQRAKVLFDWNEIQIESLARSVELRRQKWIIQRRELELIAARNLLLPRLDAVALYRWLGAGDDLIDPNGRGVPPFPGSNAYSTLTSGDFQEWQLGFNFSMPLGFRQQFAGVRNAQLQLARERARLEGQELELAHALTEAVRNLECKYVVAQRRLDEWISTQEEVRQHAEIWKSGIGRIGKLEVRNTDVMDAIAKRAVAETAYYQALVDYNRAIAEVHFRKGSLLEYNRVYLTEGPWPKRAYLDAREKALRRASAWPLDYVLRPRPGLVSRGVHPQDSADAPAEAVAPSEPTPAEPLPPPAGKPAPAEAPSDAPQAIFPPSSAANKPVTMPASPAVAVVNPATAPQTVWRPWPSVRPWSENASQGVRQ
jgi:outer membrane protein TolC